MRSELDYMLTTRIAALDAASTALLPIPDDGKIIKIMSVLGGAIASTDAVITCSIGGTDITGGAITIAYDSSAEGDIDYCFPTALNSVAEGDYVKALVSTTTTNTIAAELTFIIRRGDC